MHGQDTDETHDVYELACMHAPDARAMAESQLIAQWQEIQREIASKVVERTSDDFPHRKISFGAKEEDDAWKDDHDDTKGHRFEYLPLDIDDEDDNITDDGSLYGGVDVSFGPSDQIHSQGTAVAVYVVLRRRRLHKSTEVESRQQKKYNTSKHKRQPHSELLSHNYELVYFDSIFYTPNVPYMSGYLAFREIEPLQTLVQRQIEQKPECTPRVILVDGNGILHPRRAGIACFLGVRTGVPTIGIGKKLCCVEGCWSVDEAETAIAVGVRDAALATPESMVGPSYVIADTEVVRFGKTESSHDDRKNSPSLKESVEMLATTPCSGYSINLQSSSGKLLGAALVGHGGKANGRHGKQTSNPIYLSVGHKTSLKESIFLCTKLSNSRIPEPARVADLQGRKLMRERITG